MRTTSRSAIATLQNCPRKRYWAYEAANGTGTAGWERRKLTIPLVTGIYVHQGLEELLHGTDTASAAAHARELYLSEVSGRGLMVEDGTDEQSVVEEQAAHVEALVLAWGRVRLPHWREEYEVVEVEVEDRVPLGEDLTLAVRADVIVRRRYDGRMFVVNFKTVAQADERWMRSWEVDMQLMTELLAAERRHGQVFGGVIIEGLIKGRRGPEKNSVGDVIGYRDQTPLLYGYKVDANPPLQGLEYTYEYTRRKGWYRFPVWKEQFPNVPHHVEAGTYKVGDIVPTTHFRGLEYWINWLPEEVVEGQMVVVPAIMREGERIEAKVRQIVAMERRVARGVELASACTGDHDMLLRVLDQDFPTNEGECYWPSKCPCFDLCYTNGVAQDPEGSGLYQPRTDHHAPVKEVE